jgi:hypothetical protein
MKSRPRPGEARPNPIGFEESEEEAMIVIDLSQIVFRETESL